MLLWLLLKIVKDLGARSTGKVAKLQALLSRSNINMDNIGSRSSVMLSFLQFLGKRYPLKRKIF